MAITTTRRTIVAAAASVLLTALPLHAAEIVINNVDAPGIGFNDETPVDPVGGNQGTTLGEQRLIVFQTAADIWGQRLQSDVRIVVQATFQPLPCEPTTGVLGSAGPIQIFRADDPAPPGIIPATWYHAALFNSIVGADQAPGDPDPGLLVPPFADDIVSFFNGAIGTDPNCLTGLDWYNGLDNEEGPNDLDLLAVVMHELAHGLGFSEFADEETGEQFAGFPSIFARYMLDTNQNAIFADMSPEQRLQAQVAGEALVWVGMRVTRNARRNLRPRAIVGTLFPRSLRGRSSAQAASFGHPLLGGLGAISLLKLADDGVDVGSDGCEPLVNRVRYKIVLIDRGGCAFTTKVLNAQDAGAIGAVIANNVPGGPAPMGGFDAAVRIPSVGITLEEGDAYKDVLPSLVLVRLFGDRRLLAGADDSGFVRLFAPDPVQPGSSKSHFDVSATPNLLMEPSINPDLAPVQTFDLTDDLFRDIGWILQH